MRVHHIINDIELANGGAQKIVRLLHQGLLQRGVDSRILTLTGDVSDLEAADSLGYDRVRDPRSIIAMAHYLPVNFGSGDIVHAHLFPANLFVSLAVRLARWKGAVVATEHNTSNRRRGTVSGSMIDSTLYAPYQRIACISEGAQKALAGWKPKLENLLELIPNGTELSFNSYFERSCSSRPVVVSMGRLHTQKNYEIALRAVAMLDDLDFEYWIAGVGDDEPRLKSLASELGVAAKVTFKGFVADVQGLLRKADIFLMPSKWEGFGLSAVEAMNAGLPCVVSDVDGLREVVTDECAFRALPGRPDLFAKYLRALVGNPELRDRMGKAAFDRSLQFSADTMVERYLDFYEGVLND